MRRVLIVAIVLFVMESLLASVAHAGPLLDWWRSRPRLFGRRTQPVTAMMPAVPATTVTALSPQTAGCSVSCPVQTVQRVSVSYVPQTSFRTNWVQTPVTSYRPETTTDPCTGCQVTCVKPCTTYRWQLRRVPYTTYRPVYQTVNVQMPAVAATSACGSCAVPLATGSTPFVAPTTPGIVQQGVVQQGVVQQGAVQPGMSVPGMGSGQSILSNGGVPADQAPTLNGGQPFGASRIIVPGTDPTNNGAGNNGAAAGNGAGSPTGGNGSTNAGQGSNSRHMPQRLETPASCLPD